MCLLNPNQIFEVIVQTRVEGLPLISKHREELKLRGGAEKTSNAKSSIAPDVLNIFNARKYTWF